MGLWDWSLPLGVRRGLAQGDAIRLDEPRVPGRSGEGPFSRRRLAPPRGTLHMRLGVVGGGWVCMDRWLARRRIRVYFILQAAVAWGVPCHEPQYQIGVDHEGTNTRGQLDCHRVERRQRKRPLPVCPPLKAAPRNQTEEERE